MSQVFRQCAAAALAVAGALAATSSHAVLISSGPVAPNPVLAGTGLNGAFYDTDVAANLSNANTLIASGSTQRAAFLAKVIDYPQGSGSVPDGTPLSTYLGTNAANVVGVNGGNPNTQNLADSLFRFHGYINITSAMDTDASNGTIDVTFRVGSDDGMRLTIGNTVVTSYLNDRAFGYSDGVASFSTAGLYAIELVYGEEQGNTGVEMLWKVGSSTAAFGLVGTANLYTVPEPGSIALAGLALLGAAASRRKARRKQG